jgi:hypothetical protein
MGARPRDRLAAYNDIADCHRELRSSQTGFPFASVENGRLRIDFSSAEQATLEYRREPMYTLRRWSGLYRLVSDARWKWMSRRQVRRSATAIPRRFQLYMKSPPPVWEEAWTIFDTVLGELVAESQKQGSALVVVSVPSGLIIHDAV